jgi:biotin carboxyl carrier protein
LKRRFRITFEGKTYELEVEEIGLEAASEAGRAGSSPPSYSVSSLAELSTGSGQVLAPAPGKVLKVSVQPGDTVRSGDELLVLESMKIETRIQAPVTGQVSDVKVKPGDTVKTGELMVVIQS